MAVTLKGNNGTYEGTSEDNKPLDVPVNTEFNELDTGKTYYFDGESWNEEPPCEGGGFTPTTEQLAAMNSGIDSNKVAQIETNESNISTAQKNGVKNLLNTYSISAGYRYGITYTVNSDGSISTTAGTATQNSNITVTMTLPAGTYYVSGCPDGGNKEEPFNFNASITGIGDQRCRVTNSTMVSSFTLTETTEVTWRFRVYNGKSIAATTFYPMIYQYGDSNYQPYAMSNVELTEAIRAIQAQLADQ